MIKKKNSKFNEKFVKTYDQESTNKYILEADVEYLKNLYDLHSNLPFLPEKMKIKNYNKLVCNLYDCMQLRCAYKKFKTSVKSWINILKSA